MRTGVLADRGQDWTRGMLTCWPCSLFTRRRKQELTDMNISRLCLTASCFLLLSGCAVISVVDTAVGVTTTVVSTAVDVTAGAVQTVAGSSDKDDDSDEDCKKDDKEAESSSKRKCKDD
jgi:hypothetical protein